MSKKTKSDSTLKTSNVSTSNAPLNNVNNITNGSTSSTSTTSNFSNLPWKYLSSDDLNRFENQTVENIESSLAQMFNLNDYKVDLKQACFLDFYLTQYWWAAREKHYSHEQISSYFSIVYMLLNNIKEKKFKIGLNLEEFKHFLLELLNDRVKIFNDEQLKEIISHTSKTFFENYRLFEYLLNGNREQVAIVKEIEVECPKQTDQPYPPPLDEAMPEDIYNKYILKIEPEQPETSDETLKADDDKPENIQLSDEVIQEIHNKFAGISLQDAKKIIFEVTSELMSDLKADMKSKIKERESALINELTKSTTSKISHKK